MKKNRESTKIMEQIKNNRKDNQLKCILHILWLVTVASSFLGSDLFGIAFPGIGQLYPFRFFLPITGFVFVIWLIRERIHPWKSAGVPEKACYIFIILLLVHSAVSLAFAIDFLFSFQRFFNLFFDLFFFFLALRLCQDRDLLKKTINVVTISLLLLCIAGCYEIFFGAIYNHAYDQLQRVYLFYGIFQYPVVLSSNTNDYAAILTFSVAAVLIHWAKEYLQGKKNLWIPLGLYPLCFFVVFCTTCRLAVLSMWILFVGLVLFFLFSAPKKIWIPVIILGLLLGVNFINRYHYVMPALSSYVQGIINGSDYKPNLEIVDPDSITLKEEIWGVNEDGSIVLNQTNSGGIRVGLLIHSLNCLKKSWGMGVGLGNTEQLAKSSIALENGGIWSIHCFLARMLGDFGIWFLAPFIFVVFLLLKRIVLSVSCSIRTKNKNIIGYSLFYFFALVIYPIVSTSSSDTQDIWAMWLYLGLIVVLGDIKRGEQNDLCLDDSVRKI